jgi:hypothetical protein
VSQSELLILVASVLEDAGVPFMVTGSFASTIHGEPRLSHDIDMVIQLQPRDVPSIACRFQDLGFYADEESLAEAVARQDQCNLIHMESGEKVDFWVLTNSPFDRSRFERRIQARYGEHLLGVSSAEDTILMKLVWDQQSGGSEKQTRDVLRVYETQFATLDEAYLSHWSRELGISETLETIKQQAQVGN